MLKRDLDGQSSGAWSREMVSIISRSILGGWDFWKSSGCVTWDVLFAIKISVCSLSVVFELPSTVVRFFFIPVRRRYPFLKSNAGFIIPDLNCVSFVQLTVPQDCQDLENIWNQYLEMEGGSGR